MKVSPWKIDDEGNFIREFLEEGENLRAVAAVVKKDCSWIDFSDPFSSQYWPGISPSFADAFASIDWMLFREGIELT